MRGRRRYVAVLALAALTIPASAAAHGFGRLYNLPVPFWLYAWAASAALVLSFLLAGLFATSDHAAAPPRSRDISASRGWRLLRRAKPALQLISVLLLVLCIVSGFIGNRDPFRNFNMTFFWVVFLLGFTYLTAVVGDLYAAINPWRVLADALGRLAPRYTAGRFRYAEWLGDWPALALYLGFIWYELFGFSRPRDLAEMLLAYSAINLGGVWLVGRAAWFRHCEFFAVFLRLVALISPLDYRPADRAGEPGRVLLRRPFTGLMQQRPTELSTVVFVLAMLATTAFDGLRATEWWVHLFWADPTGLVTAAAGERPLLAYAALRPWYIRWETLCLVASPFLYFAAYLVCIAAARGLTCHRRSGRDTALDFAYTLLPIALVYHLTHYATLLLTQGLQIVSLASDPLGRDWDLFGTATLLRGPILPGMGLVWHTQVGLILVGHAIGVHLAHGVALRTFGSRRRALLSQLPMLGFMVCLTVAGLWIIAQPLTVERMR